MDLGEKGDFYTLSPVDSMEDLWNELEWLCSAAGVVAVYSPFALPSLHA